MSAASASAPPVVADEGAIRDYLDDLYGSAEGGFLPIFRAPGDQTDWVAIDDLGAAAAMIRRRCEEGFNAYHGMGLHRKPLGPRRRGTADGVIAIPGLYMDLDLHNPAAHTETALPGTVDDVVRLLAESPLPPSLLIHSGHGLYAHWLFREVLTLNDARERSRAETALRRLQAEIRRLGRGHGWKFDSTSDLARVLRPPGVQNRKTGSVKKPVMAER
jgi:putative DNA primase/helicase